MKKVSFIMSLILLMGMNLRNFAQNNSDKLTESEEYYIQLEEEYPALKSLIQEYRDGLLLFEITNEKVWSRAINDSIGLLNYFKKNKSQYLDNNKKQKTFLEAEELVAVDYQTYLEKVWVTELRKKYPVSINDKALSEIKADGTVKDNDNIILLTIDGSNFTKSEFLVVYNKNNKKEKSTDELFPLEKYLELYINFKLKVKEAEDLGMDKTASFKTELAGYRKELSKPYIKGKDIPEKNQSSTFSQSKNDSIRWNRISESQDSVIVKQFIEECKIQDYKNEAIEKLCKIREREKYAIDIKNIKTIAEWESFVSSNINLLVGEKYSYYYNAIDTIESLIINDIATNGIRNKFVITEIKPLVDGVGITKTAIIGKGSMPKMSDDFRKVKGINIKMIAPISQGSSINFVVGSAYMETGNFQFITKSEAVTFIPTYNNKGINNNVAEGAIWKITPLIIQGGKIDKKGGVGIWKTGTDEIKVGSMYPADGNLIFKPINVNGTEILIPGGNTNNIHRFIGNIQIGDYTFIGEENPVYPLTFLLDSKFGYVYIRGKGKVILPSGVVKEFN